MILLDENFPEDQRCILRRWRISHRQIGRDAGAMGINDPDIITLLHGLHRATFFTMDKDFFKRRLCHPLY